VKKQKRSKLIQMAQKALGIENDLNRHVIIKKG